MDSKLLPVINYEPRTSIIPTNPPTNQATSKLHVSFLSYNHLKQGSVLGYGSAKNSAEPYGTVRFGQKPNGSGVRSITTISRDWRYQPTNQRTNPPICTGISTGMNSKLLPVINHEPWTSIIPTNQPTHPPTNTPKPSAFNPSFQWTCFVFYSPLLVIGHHNKA